MAYIWLLTACFKTKAYICKKYLMICSAFQYSNHALAQMFRRGITADEVEAVIIEGEKINDYPYDKPYASSLVLHFVNGRPIHVVVSQDDTMGICYIITAYLPDTTMWSPDFKTKI